MSGPGYSVWRARAAAELNRLHGIDADRIPDQIWKHLYVQNYTLGGRGRSRREVLCELTADG